MNKYRLTKIYFCIKLQNQEKLTSNVHDIVQRNNEIRKTLQLSKDFKLKLFRISTNLSSNLPYLTLK